jgi:hypothetical protein
MLVIVGVLSTIEVVTVKGTMFDVPFSLVTVTA